MHKDFFWTSKIAWEKSSNQKEYFYDEIFKFIESGVK